MPPKTDRALDNSSGPLMRAFEVGCFLGALALIGIHLTRLAGGPALDGWRVALLVALALPADSEYQQFKPDDVHRRPEFIASSFSTNFQFRILARQIGGRYNNRVHTAGALLINRPNAGWRCHQRAAGHSWRSARIGSTLVARSAGIRLASTATTIRNSAAPAMLTGSAGLTW